MKASTIGSTVRRQWQVVAAVFVIGLVALLVAYPHLHKYTATSTLLASSAPANSAGLLDPTKDPTASAIGLFDLQSLAVSESVLKPVAERLNLSRVKEQRLALEVKAKPLFGSNILPIAVTDSDPNLAIAIANGVTQQLAMYSEHLATGRYDELISNLNAQIVSRRQDLARIDARIQAVAAGDFYITPENGTTAIDTRLIALQQQAQQLQATVKGDEAASSLTDQQPAISRSLARHEIIAADPAVTAQREQLGKDIAQLNLGLSAYTLNYPGLKSYILQVRKETAAVNRAESRTASDPGESASYVAAEIAANRSRAALAADTAQLASVQSQIGALQGHLEKSTSSGSEIAQLRRARSADEDVYNDLSQRLAKANADRAQAGSISSVVVIDHATTAGPALLGRPEVLVPAVFVVTLWLAITLAFFVDGSDDRLRTPESIEKLYGKPVFMPVN